MSVPLPIWIWAPGTPTPAGSKTAVPMRRGSGGPLVINDLEIRHGAVYGRPVMQYVDGSLSSSSRRARRAWITTLKLSGQAAMPVREPIDFPVRLEVDFILSRPRFHLGSGRNAERVLPRFADAVPAVKPDVTKLLRCIEDALTGIIWKDDALVVQTYSNKRYIRPHEDSGARIMVGHPRVEACAAEPGDGEPAYNPVA